MFIDHELRELIACLDEAGLPYALCGGLAMAVHGFPRATLDIDLVALNGSAEAIKAAAHTLGYTLQAAPMQLAQRQLEIMRVSKPDPVGEEVLPLDILILNPSLEATLEIEQADWDGLPLRVISRSSLIRMKELRASHQDAADIERLLS